MYLLAMTVKTFVRRPLQYCILDIQGTFLGLAWRGKVSSS